MKRRQRRCTRPALAWIDTEETGLMRESGEHRVLEIGVQLTDTKLRPLGPGLQQTIGVDPDAAEALMSTKVRDMHTASGLLADLRRNDLPRLTAAEQAVIEHCQRYHDPERELWLAGRNPDHDREFLARDMPALHGLLHPYRQIDVCQTERAHLSPPQPTCWHTRPRDLSGRSPLAHERGRDR